MLERVMRVRHSLTGRGLSSLAVLQRELAAEQALLKSFDCRESVAVMREQSPICLLGADAPVAQTSPAAFLAAVCGTPVLSFR